jgi:hypothetical protein
VPDLTAELRRVKRDPSASSSGRWLKRAGLAATGIPGVIPAMYALMARSVAARQHIGTVAVTAVGMFVGGGGCGITSLSLMSLEVIVGGMSQRPAGRGHEWPGQRRALPGRGGHLDGSPLSEYPRSQPGPSP